MRYIDIARQLETWFAQRRIVLKTPEQEIDEERSLMLMRNTRRTGRAKRSITSYVTELIQLDIIH